MSSLELQARSVQSILCSPPSTPQVTIPDNDSPFNPFANVVSTPQPVTKPKGYGSHSQPFTQKKKTPPKAVKTPDVANAEPSTPPRKLSVSEFRRFPVVRGIASSSREWRLMQADAEALHWHGVRLVKLVGSGPVSTVYEAEDFTRKDDTGKPLKVAARVMDWSTVPGIYQRSVYPKLMKIYEMFPSHPNIVGLIQRIVDGPTNYLLQEWCSLGSLHVALGPSGCLARGASELTAREILKQVCQGLQFLLDHDVPHGRLTSENVLLDRNMCVKLSDYGYPASSCSNCTDDDLHLRFRAPEMLMGKTFTAYAGDVWSLGVVLYFTLHSALPFTATDVANSARCINLPPLQCRTSLSYPCVMFLKRLLTFNARSRPSLKDAIIDPWMTQAPKKRPIQHVPCFRDHLRYIARLL